MTRKPKPKQSSINVDLGARVEAKLEVRAEIPPSSAGRLVDAITDFFRPYSEKQGLRADQIRLQREEVAIEIAKLARRKAQIESTELIHPPLKVLIPLLEKGSQESIEDEFMINIWSNLLLSASSEDSVPPRFVSIVAEMDGNQARLFDEIARKNIKDRKEVIFLLDDTVTELKRHNIEIEVLKLINENKIEPDVIYESLKPIFDRPEAALIDIIVHTVDENYYSIPTTANYISNYDETNFDILSSLGLLQEVTIYKDIGVNPIRSNKSDAKMIMIIYYYITLMGFEFF